MVATRYEAPPRPHDDPSEPPVLSGWGRVLGLPVALSLLVGLLLAAFAWPAVTAAPHELPIGVVGPAAAVQQVQGALQAKQPGAFHIQPYGSAAEARAAIESREIYGAVVVEQPPTLLVATGASPAVAQLLTQVAGAMAAQSGAGQSSAGPTVTDVVPGAAGDPHGIGVAVLALPLVLGGLLSGVALRRLVRGRGRLACSALLLSLLAGLASATILNLWLNALGASFWTDAAVITFGFAAVSFATLGAGTLAGNAGAGLVLASLLLVGNPLSGLSSAPELLPVGWSAVGQAFPLAATGQLLRSEAFFDWAAAGRPALVLSVWLATGLFLFVLGALRRSRRPAA
ncbi:hypothetical protein GCM10009841_11520 [Microlunatus panaciterrae]|uniref:ABC transporter permease n=1 Tax=Microlunatus panaciterrae TaxID=400768 RepID=A0ABS2RL18_9ACTN|nr:hypothetical protein [Microlunatus panaciterrae]MBM7799708.1 hypothetical protein [Microlunatus panaciterrae]